MLGSVLVPEMRKQGYSSEMSIGPVLGAGTLASMIPPTALGVLLASLAEISVGYFLLAIIVPGLMMASAFTAYIIFRAYTHPECAPRYPLAPKSIARRVKDGLLYILPLSVIVFLVIGLILLGVATPNEAGALGALGCFLLAFIYQRGVRWDMIMRAVRGTITVTGMLFLIFAASTAFTQLLAFTGATQGLVDLAVDAGLSRLGMLAIMMGILLVMGCLMEPLSILMISVPIFVPLAVALDIDVMVLSVMMLVNMEVAVISPPFGMSLFVMKGVLPPDISMTTIWKSAVPFIVCIIVVIAVLMFAPQTATWLPNLARGQ
jgi:tripartite ATP-independent transporter DctM subunit